MHRDTIEDLPNRQQRETHHDEPIRRWTTLPITEDRAKELVDLLTEHDTDHVTDALIELLCGVMPDSGDDNSARDLRHFAALAAVMQAFTYSTRAQNELGEHVVHLKVGKWE